MMDSYLKTQFQKHRWQSEEKRRRLQSVIIKSIFDEVSNDDNLNSILESYQVKQVIIDKVIRKAGNPEVSECSDYFKIKCFC